MPNIATVLKDEIARVARKAVRSEIAGLRKATAAHRAEIAALKRRLQAVERELRRVAKAHAKGAPADDARTPPGALRFSPKSLASQRRRLGLSATDCALLLGTSGQSVYNWEGGKARPRAAQLAAIAALRNIGKKEAAARLAALRESA